MGAARRAHHRAEKARRDAAAQLTSVMAQEAAMKKKGQKLIDEAKSQFYQPDVSFLETILGDTDFGIQQAKAPKSPALGLKIALGGKVQPKVPEGVNVLKPGEYVKAELPPGISEEEAKAKLLAKLKKPTKEEEANLKTIKEAHYKNIAALNNLEYEPTSAVDNKSKLANFDVSGLLNTPNQSLDPNQIDFSTLVGLDEPTVDPIPLPSSITEGELNTMLSTLTGLTQPKSDYDILINKLTS